MSQLTKITRNIKYKYKVFYTILMFCLKKKFKNMHIKL